MTPLAIDLFCGLGGWTEGLLAEGYRVVGFDIERHVYGEHRYPAQLVLQDVLTIHGRQFKGADLIVASPPCQEYSYMAMPWSLAKEKQRQYEAGERDVKQLTALFDACFRIQREACAAAGRHIPLVVENVRGAQRWVGKARWNFGSFYLWGDVPALMPITRKAVKVSGFRFDGSGRSFQTASVDGVKLPGNNSAIRWSDREIARLKDYPVEGQKMGRAPKAPNGVTRRLTNPGEWREGDIKNGGDWFSSGSDCSLQRRQSSKGSARKHASAMIAKIPLVLSRHIAASWKPEQAA